MENKGDIKHVVIALISRKRDNKTSEYLLIRSKKDFGQFTGFWYPPGGHMEKGEDEKTALVREMHEELRLDVHPLRQITETAGDVKNQVTHWWACDLLSDNIKINKTEIAEVGWFTKDELGNMQLWPATKSFFEKHVFST